MKAACTVWGGGKLGDYTQEETFHMMRVLESIITLSDPEGDKEQDENTEAPTDKVSA